MSETATQAQGHDRGPWIQTYTGRAFYYEDPQPADIHIEDIAQALSNQCRYAGHCCSFYSVAEHSVLVSQQFADPELRMIGLLHDATEAYVLDVPKPLKALLPEYERFEHQLWRIIARRFRLATEIPAAVHDADLRMLMTERPQLFPRMLPWPKYEHVKPIEGVRVWGYSPGEARRLFLETFHAIERQR